MFRPNTGHIQPSSLLRHRPWRWSPNDMPQGAEFPAARLSLLALLATWRAGGGLVYDPERGLVCEFWYMLGGTFLWLSYIYIYIMLILIYFVLIKIYMCIYIYIYFFFFFGGGVLYIYIKLMVTLEIWNCALELLVDPPGTVAPVTPELLEPPKDRGGWKC